MGQILMVTHVKDSGIVQTTVKEFPVLAVNVLARLGYEVRKGSNLLDQILATERVDEEIGKGVWWHHEYRIVLRWRKTVDRIGVFVSVDVSEHKDSGTQSDCKKRCDRILLELQNDAERASEVKGDKEANTAFGTARWGTEQELREAGYFQKRVDPRCFIIGRGQTNEYLQVPELLTYAHALVCGRTGVGKSRGFFIPQLIERIGTNMIVTEATPGYEAGELYKLTSGWRKQAGHAIYCFNPADMSSHRINPIDRIRQAPDERKAAVAEALAELIIMNGESSEQKNEQTWNRSEKILLIPLILHAAASEPEYGHFGSLRWLLLQGPDRLAKVLRNSPSQVAQMEFEGWMRLAGETNFKYGVFSGLITKLNPWMTDQIVTLTESTDIDLDALKEQLFTFYLAVPSRSRDSKLIGSLMVNFLLDHVLEIREQMKYPVAMLLDEFTNFGKISGIGDTLSIIRKNKIGLILGFQNYFQLEQVYSRKEAHIIVDMPATQVYFKQKNYREAKELSDALGHMTVEETTVGDGGRVQEFVRGRALATPDELINLKNEVIVFTPSTPPLKLPLTSPKAYEAALAYASPEREEHQVNEFVRTRGRTARKQTKEWVEQKLLPKPRPNELLNTARNEREPTRNLEEREHDEEDFKKRLPPKRDDNAPDLGDVWQV
jgi:type IV secretory pathway TraG/TraD family ATPase VirD4